MLAQKLREQPALMQAMKQPQMSEEAIAAELARRAAADRMRIGYR